MKIYQPSPGMYDFQHLPGFARFLLENHLRDFVDYQLAYSRELNLPFLTHLSKMTEEEVREFGMKTSAEYLQYLSRNAADDQVRNSMERWLSDQLSVIGKHDLSAEDITGLNFARHKAFKKLLRLYDIPEKEKLDLIDEFDTFFYGSITSATNIFTDVLKTRIRDESNFSEKLVNLSPGIIFIFDLKKRTEIYINGNVNQVMGYTGEELLGLGSNFLPALTHAEDISKLQGLLEDIQKDRDGKSYQLEYRFRHKDGSYKWLRTYAVVFRRDDVGVPVEVLGTAFEITKEKNTADALQLRESQLLEAQAIAQIGSFEWDLTTNKSVNTPGLSKIIETDGPGTPEDFLRNICEEDRGRVQKLLGEAMKSGNFDCQYRYNAPSGQKVLWARGIVLFNDGKPVLCRGTLQDITQLKRIEDALVVKTHELERSNESLQQFASVASHDLKEPLRKMSMYSDMVLSMEKNLSEQSLASLEKVKSAALRMQQMIEDILNFSTIISDDDKVLVDLTAVIDEVVGLLDESIKEKGAVIRYGALPEVRVIKTQIRQMFQNLISNSLKFSRQNVAPEISISHSQLVIAPTNGGSPRKCVKITVRDNGIGFRQEHAERIFSLFTRLHGRAVYEGSGFGLAICKKIAENHGGSITATSSPGSGASFVIELPAD